MKPNDGGEIRFARLGTSRPASLWQLHLKVHEYWFQRPAYNPGFPSRQGLNKP